MNKELIDKIESLHKAAMDFAELAFVAKRKKDQTAAALFSRAFDNEAQAAELLASLDMEPSRSIFMRSAAALAIDCGKYNEADRFVKLGLSGKPPEEIKNELEQLAKEVNNHLV